MQPTCDLVKTVFQAGSIVGGGTGCCGNADSSLDVPDCSVVQRGSNTGTGLVGSYAEIPASPLIADGAYGYQAWFASFPSPSIPDVKQINSTYSAAKWAADEMKDYTGFETFTTFDLATKASKVAETMNKDECVRKIRSHYVGESVSVKAGDASNPYRPADTFYGKMQVSASEYVYALSIPNLVTQGEHFVFTDDVYITEIVESTTGNLTGTRLGYADHSNMYVDPLDPYPYQEKSYNVKYKCEEDSLGNVALHTVSVLDDYSCFYSKDAPSPWDKGTAEFTIPPGTKTRRGYTYWMAGNGLPISLCNTVYYTHEYYKNVAGIGLRFDPTKNSLDAISEHPALGVLGSFNGPASQYLAQKRKQYDVEIAPRAIWNSMQTFAKAMAAKETAP
jgi:hypothetical protein